uniref:Phospholipid hydroperoxide glutathione peroxidase, mitochondrial n=1 Tax=Ursus maritimus TaxID=29073 RepID=A0A452TGT8_URSMA
SRALLRKGRAPLRRSPQFFLAPGTWFSRPGSAWDPFLWGPRAGRVGQVAVGLRLRAPRSPRRSCARVLQCASRDDWRCAQSMHEFSAKDIDGRMVNLDKYRGFVCIVTNVASQ